jgi:hypothetical protein
MSWLRIKTEGARTAFRPGEILAGTADWKLDGPAVPGHPTELRLLWFTGGRGTSDAGLVETVRFETPDEAGSGAFRFQLPEGPYSFAGKLIPWTGRSRPSSAATSSAGSRSRSRRRGNRCGSRSGGPLSLQQRSELFLGETGVAHNAAQRIRVHGVMAWDGEDPNAVGHDDVLALSKDSEPGSFESPHSLEVRDARIFPKTLDLDLDLADLEIAQQICRGLHVLVDGIFNVGQGFFFCGPLRPASRETGNGDAIALFGVVESDSVFHGYPSVDHSFWPGTLWRLCLP